MAIRLKAVLSLPQTPHGLISRVILPRPMATVNLVLRTAQENLRWGYRTIVVN